MSDKFQNKYRISSTRAASPLTPLRKRGEHELRIIKAAPKSLPCGERFREGPRLRRWRVFRYHLHGRNGTFLWRNIERQNGIHGNRTICGGTDSEHYVALSVCRNTVARCNAKPYTSDCVYR